MYNVASKQQQSQPKSNQSSTSRATRRRLRFLFLAMLCFLGWAGMKLWDQYGTVQTKAAKVQELESKLESLKYDNEQLKLQLIRLDDPEYIEQLLRKELHMTKQGETLFIETK